MAEDQDLRKAKVIGDDVIFQASAGWLEAFKRRHGICEQRLFGDGGSVLAAGVNDPIPAIVAKGEEVVGGH